ncbi:MAG: helix-turn-helix domain-containing protein [Lachnospiraceae bacterium]|nr:helix-turn-helix domain-containing protein [Lachnospiraceae bacterium]
MSDIAADDINLIIRQNLKRLRNERKMSLGQLSEACGVSKVMISQIEKGESNPTVHTLWKIAGGLKVHYTELLDLKTKAENVIRRQDVAVQTEKNGEYTSYCYYSSSQSRAFDLFVVELCPEATFETQGHLAGSKEYLLVSLGQVEVTVEGRTHILNPGDSIFFDGGQAHTYKNLGTGTASFLSLIHY